MLGENATIYTVQSDSDVDTYYEVKFYEGGKVQCDCPAAKFRGYGSTRCKHAARLEANGAGYQAPEAVEVYEITYNTSSTVVLGNDVEATVCAIVDALSVGKEVSIKRLA